MSAFDDRDWTVKRLCETRPTFSGYSRHGAIFGEWNSPGTGPDAEHGETGQPAALETERQDMREQWPRRLLKNPLPRAMSMMKWWAQAARHGQTVPLSMDQTDLDDRMAVPWVGVR